MRDSTAMDDDFSDDGFDDLNDTVLQELENNAIQFTQAQKLDQSQAPLHAATTSRPLLDEYGFDDDDLDDTDVVDERAQQPSRPSVSSVLQPQQQRVADGFERWNQHVNHNLLPPQPHQPRSAYPPRPHYPVSSRPAPLPSQRFPQGPIAQPPQPHPQSQFVRPPPPPQPLITRPYPAQPSQALRGAVPGKQGDVIAALQARLSALETELTAAKGEAAIIRSKYDKAQAANDAEVSRLKTQNAEHAAKQERMVEAALAAERSAATELQFARQDLREELGRAKSRKKDGATTPKKNSKSWGVADGFDSLEIAGSPSKGQGQKRKDSAAAVVPLFERTPTKGKRKRPAVDSPNFALETHSGDPGVDDVSTTANPVPIKAGSGALPYDFLKLALDHSPFHGQPLTFDLLSRFSFPSNPSLTFSSIIFQKLPQMGSAQEPLRLLIDFAELMIDLWQQCLSERYHAPVYYLAALISYVLQLNTVVVTPHIISSLIPVCTTTCQLVGLPRFNSIDGDISQHPDQIVRQLHLDGDVTQSLALLYLAALGCLSSSNEESSIPLQLDCPPLVQFWKTVSMDFVVIMLSPNHPELDWFGMLSLLWTSVLPDSIGPIPNDIPSTTHGANGSADIQTPELVGNVVVDRVSAGLCELPTWAAPGSVKELLVRLAVLKTLAIFSTSSFGILRLAHSSATVQRLVLTLCWAVDQLYDTDAPPPSRGMVPEQVGRDESRAAQGHSTRPVILDPTGVTEMEVDGVAPPEAGDSDLLAPIDDLGGETGQDIPALLCRIVSQAMLLLHAIVTDPRTANVVDMTSQLAASNGGAQRYLLTLARLNFSDEDLVLEAGLDAETVELAHELLEIAVTPDEGEGMGQLFGI